ncbi:MAG: glycosyltransferase family 39 protein [Candidatus Eremiobacteraeota bacterium]|nr:glycosyltransferase family 39 protein [Candidatus Eremiobacteraeota bacterium]
MKVWQEILAVFLLSLLIRLLWLGEASLWLDEAFSNWMAQKDVADILAFTRSGDIHPPLFYLGLHAWLKIFPSSEWFLRLPQALAGSAAVALLYVLALRLTDRRTARISAALAATSQYLLLFDQECRMYPWVSLAEMLYALALLGLARNSRAAFLLLLLATWMGWSVDYRFALFAAAAGSYFLVRNRNRMTLAALVLAALGTLPLIPWVLQQNGPSGQGNSLRLCHLPISLESLTSLPPALMGAWYLQPPLVVNCLLTVAVVGLVGFYRRGQGLAVCGFLGQWFPVVLYSVLRSSIYSIHSCQSLALPFLLALAGALAQAPRRVGQVLLGAWLILNLGMFYRSHHEPSLAKQNWRILSEQILPMVEPGDLVVVLPAHQAFPLRYYYSSDRLVELNPVDLRSSELVAPLLKARRCWWIFAGDLIVDPGGYSRRWMDEHFAVESAVELVNGPFHEITGGAIQVYLSKPKK